MNRLRAGEALVRNPMQKNQVSRILLTPETVDAFVFWKKNPTSFLHCLPEIQALGYPFYFLFTLTPYDATLEPGVPQTEKRLEVFRRLSELIGAENVTCPHGCIYCYAVSTTAKALMAHQRFDPLSPLLCDTLPGDEIITTAAVRKRGVARAAEPVLALQQGELWPQRG